MGRKLTTVALSLSSVGVLIFPVVALAAYGLTQSAAPANTKYFSVAAGAPMAFTDNFTLETWVKLPSLPAAGTAYTAISKTTATPSNSSFYFYVVYDVSGTNYVLYMQTYNGSTGHSTQVAWTPTTNTWYHVAVTYASGSVKYYVDGVQQGTTQTDANTSINAVSGINTELGRDGTFNDYMAGSMSLVRIWSQVQSAATIAANKCTVFGSAQTGMVAEWSLNNVLTDASGNGLTLTNNGTVPFSADVPSVCATVPTPSFFGIFTLFGNW
jgi:hypothetical protein